MSEEALRTLALSVRNWGRWGPDDEIGTLNYITPDTIAAAGRLVTSASPPWIHDPLQPVAFEAKHEHDPWVVVAGWTPELTDLMPAAVALAEADRVYTSEDPGVTPARLVRPRLPSMPPPGVRLEDLPQVDLVISATGEVDSVKLRSPGANVQSAMMLSAIKTWRFEPALRNMTPVRFRTTLVLTSVQ